MNEDTIQRIKEVLSYNPTTGIFIWKESLARRKQIGDIAGSLDPREYITLCVQGKRYYAHRLAFLFMEDLVLTRGTVIDHVDNNPSNNAWDNLRIATASSNAHNAATAIHNISGIKGICYESPTYNGKIFRYGRYTAKIVAEGLSYSKSISMLPGRDKEQILSELKNWLEAVRQLHHGEFANNG